MFYIVAKIFNPGCPLPKSNVMYLGSKDNIGSKCTMTENFKTKIDTYSYIVVSTG